MELKVMLMSTVEIRSKLHQLIDEVDERFLKAVYLMVSAYQEPEQEDEIVGYRTGTNEPVYKSKLSDELDEAVARVQAGEFITLEDLEAESETW